MSQPPDPGPPGGAQPPSWGPAPPPPGSPPPPGPAGYGQPYGAPAGAYPGTAGYGATGPAGQPWATPRNGLGVAALVCGIASIVLGLLGIFLLPLLLSFPLGIAAIPLGIAGRRRVQRGAASNGGAALSGLLLGIAGIVVSAVVAVGVVFFFSTFSDCFDPSLTPEQQQQCVEDKVIG